tara:strand:+ start:240 stop:512 length:273 start_codon:yes stop_codon:yes gene_type:complete
MSYILTLKNRPEGVFSVVSDITGEHVIPIFDDKDDIFRYAEQLVEDPNNPPLQVIKIPTQEIVTACKEKKQQYVIITIDDMMIPPIELHE